MNGAENLSIYLSNYLSIHPFIHASIINFMNDNQFPIPQILNIFCVKFSFTMHQYHIVST